MSELFIITIGYIISLLLILGFGLFVLVKSPRGGARIAFFFMCLSLAGYQVSFVLGANATNASFAYAAWFLNLVDIAIAITYLHFIILALDALPRWRTVLIGVYVIGASILAAALLFPSAFLPRVLPKLYFPYYLDGGPIHAAMLAFFLLSFALSFTVMFSERRRRGDEGKKRTDYFVISLLFGILTGPLAFPLVFNVPFDPLFSVFLFTFTLPMAYGMVKKDVLDIRIAVRRTALYTVVIALLAGFLTGISFLSEQITARIPEFIWVVPVIAAVAAVAAGGLYLRKANETERLKYEFINIATHKFRTPLTRIRWGSEALLGRKDLPDEVRIIAQEINESNLSLIQLSNLLIDAVRMEKEQYSYHYEPLDMKSIVQEVLESFHSTIAEKHIRLMTALDAALPALLGDKTRLASAMHVLIENAVAYTLNEGVIRVSLTASPDDIRFEVTDSGIGVSDEERSHLFKKFYRTDRAYKADTEGVGVGLSMAKSIIERHRGTIGASSPGIGKGSTFWFTLPTKKV